MHIYSKLNIMNRSISKIRHIQEANTRLEKRLLNEQDNNLVGKTITIFSDRGLTQQLAVVDVTEVTKGNNGGTISFNGFTMKDNFSVYSMKFNCGINLVTLDKVFTTFGTMKQETAQAYVSPKLVEFLKASTFCQQSSPQQTQKQSDF